MSLQSVVVLGLLLVVTAYSEDVSSVFQLDLSLERLGGRIVGGHDAAKGQFPHQVSLQYRRKSGEKTIHFCGGSIIGSKWILTAGHCVLAIKNNPNLYDRSIYVKAGIIYLDRNENFSQFSQAKEFIVHEKYKGGVRPYDIALLKLIVPLVFDKNVAPIRLPRSGSTPNGEVTLSGWGSISKTPQIVIPNVLQTVDLPLVSYESCKDYLAMLGNSPLHETNICTGPLGGGLAACRGDSGGPLISKSNNQSPEIVGIVSWGYFPCTLSGAPSVYVKVSSFAEWILNKTHIY